MKERYKKILSELSASEEGKYTPPSTDLLKKDTPDSAEQSGRRAVFIRTLLESARFTSALNTLTVCIGENESGEPILLSIEKLPHLLIGGSTGTGKTVCINSIIASILYRSSPDAVRMILIDPKVVEFGVYNGLPHLCFPVINGTKEAIAALEAAVDETERRFELFKAENVRNIDIYNSAVAGNAEKKPLPRIVIVIDELADLMVAARREIEGALCRLAQKSRAAGIHIIVATQRPTHEVITPSIRANIPSTIALRTASRIDSRTLIGVFGAEKLLGKGDMLISPAGCVCPVKAQGAYISEAETEKVAASAIKNNS